MKEKNLMRKSLTQFIVCVAILLVLATPVFYWLTTNYYAEDMGDLMEAMRMGKRIPKLDFEQDVMKGIMIQFLLIATVLGIAIVLTLQFINRRLWKSFDSTLEAIENFRLEDQRLPALPDTDIKEFARLNKALANLMRSNIRSYQVQKEFTENASHELQTPLAVFQGKLDILLQQSDHITEQQATIIQDLYQMTGRLSRLNRNLLLLAKMENNQFSKRERVDVAQVVSDLLPYLDSLVGTLVIERDFRVEHLWVSANRSLLESLLSNLIVNAVRHNKQDGKITIMLTLCGFSVSNTSQEPALDAQLIFRRFYRPSEKTKGNGLGLAIAKAVCDYHSWEIAYRYSEADKLHLFEVRFG